MNIGDQSLIKNINREMILETIIEQESVSRVQLAKMTGLNKATVTSQVGQLLDDGIVVETHHDKSTGGRKPILLSVDHTAGYAIGIEMDVDHIWFLLTDLAGNIRMRHSQEVSALSFEDTRKILMENISSIIDTIPSSRYGIIGIGLGIHGIVDRNQRIVFATHSNWRNIDLKEELSQTFKVPVYIDNNTNLCAFAEKTFSVEDSNVLCLTISSGIGLGIVIDNRVYKGLNGFAGEIGHMIIRENGRQCSCGNQGCWERYASERAFLKGLAVDKNMENCTLKDFERWLKEGDLITMEHLKRLAEDLCIGINNVINIFNPETIIINSELVSIYPKLIDDIKRDLCSSMNDYKRILSSGLGRDACALGAAAIVIRDFLHVSNLKFMNHWLCDYGNC